MPRLLSDIELLARPRCRLASTAMDHQACKISLPLRACQICDPGAPREDVGDCRWRSQPLVAALHEQLLSPASR